MSARYAAQNQGIGNYEYVTARVRSRRAALFDEGDYRDLIRMGVGEIARSMGDTEYEQEMDALGSRHSGVDLIEYALTRNMAKHFEDLLQWSEGQLYGYVARYLRKFDAWNVKTAIRGVYSDSDPETIETDYIRAGELSEDLLGRMANADSIEAIIDMLETTIFGRPLEEAFDDYEETGLLVPLENAVDRTFYEDLDEGLPSAGDADMPTELYVEFITAEIDFRNVRNALRIARSGADMDPSAYYIDGGRLFDRDQLRQLATNTDQLVEHIRGSIYGDDLSDALDELQEADDLIGFERALDAALLEYGDRLSSRYPLSVCPVISYVLAKEREVDNIRAIARGREADVPPEEIEDELVML